MQFYPGVDLTRVLSEFVSDLKSSMSHLFGVLMSMTNKPVYPTNELTTLQSQVDNQNLVNLTTELHFRSIYQDSNHLRNSTETSQKMVCEREKSWELALGNLHSTNHLPSLSIEPMTSFPPPLGSQSSYPSLLHIGKIQRYVPVFQKKVVKVGQNNLTLAAGSTNVVIPHTLKKYNTPDFKLKHIMPVNSTKFQVKNTRASFSQILKAKGKTETSNLVNKLTNMKNNRETFTNSINTTLEPCSSVVARKHFATALCQVHGKSLSQPSQFKKNDNELNCTKYIPACISNKRETHTNDPECGTKSSTSIAACSVLEGSIQGKYLELNTKVCRTHQTIKEVDVESHARNNQLFKLRNATLQNWLKKHGISTKARDKKEQLVTKIMQFIQES
ncbi:uncharacterized protein LOC142157804 [Mixophyes fleayi]|uniref:uncharacterized protein LOC142157804 n=1 Tax=Mixophyes fleayi TaxID=3061075 RepID=UPI003F4D9C13